MELTLIDVILVIGAGAFVLALVICWKLWGEFKNDPINTGAHIKVKRGYED